MGTNKFIVINIMVGIIFLGGVFASSIVLPSNIVATAPITINGIAIPINSQVMVNFPANSFSTYEAVNLQNIEFFYSNGTIIPSWLEGNSLNELQTINLNTASNVIYWLKVSAPNLLNSGSNTIYVGFAPQNTVLFDGITVGESPLLSTTYGQYDNGAKIFNYYQTFGGLSSNSLPNGWSSVNNGPTGEAIGYTFNTIVTNNPLNTIVSVSNGANGCGCGIFENTRQSMSPGNTIEWYGNIFNNQRAGTFAGLEANPSSTEPNPLFTWNYEAGYNQPQANVITYGLVENVQSTGSTETQISMGADADAVNTIFFDTNSNKIYGIKINSPSSFNAIVNYSSVGIDTNQQLTPSLFVFSVGLNPAGDITSLPQSIYWIRTRNNINQPTLSFGQVSPLATPVLNLNAKEFYDVSGQNLVLYANETGGMPPYTYTYKITYTDNNNIITAYSKTINSNTISIPINSLPTVFGNVFVTVTDSAGNTANSINYEFIIYAKYAVPTLSMPIPNNAVLDVNQPVTFNTIISGGRYGDQNISSMPDIYTLNLVSSSGTVIESTTFTVNGTNHGHVTFNSFVPQQGLDTYNVIATELLPAYTFNSVSNTILVNNAMVISSPTVFPNSITVGSTSTLTENTPTGGTSPYSYQWQEETPGSSSYSNISGATSNTYKFATSSSSTRGIYNFEVQVSDSAGATQLSPPVNVIVNPSAPPTSSKPISTGGPPPTIIQTTIATTTITPQTPPLSTPTTTIKPNTNTQPSNISVTNSSAGKNKTVVSSQTRNTTTTALQSSVVVSTNAGFPWWILLILLIIIIILLLYFYTRRRKNHKQHHNTKHKQV